MTPTLAIALTAVFTASVVVVGGTQGMEEGNNRTILEDLTGIPKEEMEAFMFYCKYSETQIKNFPQKHYGQGKRILLGDPSPFTMVCSKLKAGILSRASENTGRLNSGLSQSLNVKIRSCRSPWKSSS